MLSGVKGLKPILDTGRFWFFWYRNEELMLGQILKLPKEDIDHSVILKMDVTAKLSIRRRPGCASTHWR